jgi:RNA polymerase sigma factor (sigma-70 family)
MNKDSSDSVLWEAFKQGNQQAYADIYNLYIEDLLRYGYRITSNRQLIKDSIQDLFLHLWLSRNKLSEIGSIRFYLFRSLRNRILQDIKKQRGTMVLSSQELLENTIGDLSYEDSLVAAETYEHRQKTLNAAIEKLPKRQQEAIQLRYHHDFSLEQISEILEINNQSVRNLLYKAVNQIRTSIEMASLIAYFFLGLLSK